MSIFDMKGFKLIHILSVITHTHSDTAVQQGPPAQNARLHWRMCISKIWSYRLYRSIYASNNLVQIILSGSLSAFSLTAFDNEIFSTRDLTFHIDENLKHCMVTISQIKFTKSGKAHTKYSFLICFPLKIWSKKP